MRSAYHIFNYEKKLTRLFILYDESVMDDYLVSVTRPFQNYYHGDT